MKIPKKVDYAVKIFQIVDEHPKTTTELASQLKTSVFFLQQIVARLHRAGLVLVVRGPGGGVKNYVLVTNLYSIARALGYTDKSLSGLDGGYLDLLKQYKVQSNLFTV